MQIRPSFVVSMFREQGQSNGLLWTQRVRKKAWFRPSQISCRVARDNMEIHHILCPSDFSEASAHAVDQAIALADAYKAKIIALHAVSPLTSAVEAPAMDECRDRLRACFDRATKAGIAVDVEIALGLPVHRILDRASSLAAAVIVMGTHGTSGFERFVLGSVTERVLRKATCPVLTVPPRAQA